MMMPMTLFGLTIAIALQAPAPKPQPKLLEVVHVIRPQAIAVPPIAVTLLPSQDAPGNALPVYQTAATLLPTTTDALSKLRLEAYDIVGDKLPSEATADELAKIRKVVDASRDAIRVTERATRIRFCDWSAVVPSPPTPLASAIGELMPSEQVWRELAVGMRFRCYLQLAAKDYPAAFRDVSTIYGMAIHIGQADTLIHFLVSSAIKSIADQTIRQAMQSGGPNMLAALAELPRPMIAISRAAIRELGDVAALYPPLEKLDREALSPAAADAEFQQHSARYLALTKAGRGGQAVLDPAAILGVGEKMDFSSLPDAGPIRQSLEKRGYDAKLLAKMPKSQLYLLDATLRMRTLVDQTRLSLALSSGHPILTAPPKLPPEVPSPASVGVRLANLMLPAINKSREAEQRQALDTHALIFAESLRAELANPNRAWDAKLLDTPLVRATLADGSHPPLQVTWEAKSKQFTAPAMTGRVYIWKRGN